MGRFSFVGSDPLAIVEARADDADPLAVLARCTPPPPHGGPAPLGPEEVPAWIGFLAYDAAWAGRADARHRRDAATPVVRFGRYDALLAFDHREGAAYLVGDDDGALSRLEARLEAPAPRLEARVGEISIPDAAVHARAIERVLEHIAAGDVYQVNLARCFEAPFEGSALALFLAMREASPVPFGFYAAHRDLAIAGRSMERFLRWDASSRRVESRPIKGTTARAGADAEERRALRASEKEQAEHAMIVDLVRNDLGRVAETGSVKVERLLEVEPYARLHHMVSTVAARTRVDVGAVDVLRAAFPPGSVTGAPKLRAIRLIEDLEDVARGVYCGATGFVDRAGGLSLSVAIRTAQVADGRVRYHAGGGLVWASDPSREIAETELKAKVFFEAVETLRARAGGDGTALRGGRAGSPES